MQRYVTELSIGAARVTAIRSSSVSLPGTSFAQALSLEPEPWQQRLPELFARPFELPVYCFHIAVPGASILVDTGASAPIGTWSVRPTPGTVAGLAEVGVRPEEITHVMITHAHWDHHIDLTEERDGELVPVFPGARCLLNRADRNPSAPAGSLYSRTLGVVDTLGLLDTVEGDHEIVPGVTMLHFPGETPGHSLLRLESAGETCYFTGDLFHLDQMLRYPDVMMNHSRNPAMVESRRRFLAEVVREGDLLLIPHTPALGRFRRDGSGGWFEPVLPLM